jgi:hypothetical protein
MRENVVSNADSATNITTITDAAFTIKLSYVTQNVKLHFILGLFHNIIPL